MVSIFFFNEGTDFNLKNSKRVTQWVEGIIIEEGKRVGELNFIFCSDEYLLQINTSFLNHDTFTDIITFDNSNNDGTLEGDIYISIPRVIENAHRYKVSFQQELHRVIIHGVLHLLGYKDKKNSEKRFMTEKEDYCLSLWRE